MTLGSLTGELGQLGSLVADGRSNAGPVEPGSTFHDGVEVEILRISLSDRAVGTVVDNL